MKNKIILLAIVLATIIYISSCSKDKEIMNTQANTEKMHSNARIDPSLSNEEMEAAIKEFIKKLEEPSSYSAMNYEEAFEYIEATLNYKYVNYDYSKCANTEEFTGSVQITSNGDGEMDMEAIANVYDAILQDWKAKYHSISEDVKTPIVFDIIDVTPTNVKYIMTVGYGYLDLSLWGEDFVPPTSTYFENAANQYTYQLYAHLNNNQIQLLGMGNGTRIYVPNIGGEWIQDPRLHPSTPDPVPPIDNGITDYKFFYANSDVINYNGYHLSLNTIEYNYHKDQLYVYMQSFLNNTSGANYVSYARVDAAGNFPNYDYVAKHMFSFDYGITYWTSVAVSTL